MKILNHNRWKYLLLLPIIFLLLNSFYNLFVIREIKDALLEEKYIETMNSIEMLALTVETYSQDYENSIVESIEFLDNLPFTFAASYKIKNGELELVTKRDYATNFDPLAYDEFVSMIGEYDKGDITIGFTPENGEYRDLRLHFRYIPMHLPLEERYLIVTGVSYYSVMAKIPTVFTIGQWVSTVIMFIISAFLICLIVHLGYIYDRRSGDKWRNRRS